MFASKLRDVAYMYRKANFEMYHLANVHMFMPMYVKNCQAGEHLQTVFNFFMLLKLRSAALVDTGHVNCICPR